jgi:hypothetical protein
MRIKTLFTSFHPQNFPVFLRLTPFLPSPGSSAFLKSFFSAFILWNLNSDLFNLFFLFFSVNYALRSYGKHLPSESVFFINRSFMRR